MKITTFAITAAATIILSSGQLNAQDKAKPVTKKEDAVKVDKVIVTVDGKVFKESDIDKAVQAMIPPGQKPTADQIAEYKKQSRQPIIDGIIINHLIDNAIAANTDITVTPAELRQFLMNQAETQAKSQKMTLEQFKEMLKKRGMSFDSIIEKQIANPELKKVVKMDKMVKEIYGSEMSVSDADLQKEYKDNLKTQYSNPEARVTASHILVMTQGKNDAEKAKAKAKAESILKEVKAGGDFAKLAQKYSECPSGKSAGGNLGSFPRTGAMVEPFAKAAFDLKDGGISGIVETKFGYHIIKRTGSTKAGPIPFEKLKEVIRQTVKMKKKFAAQKKFWEKLKAAAKIVYPNVAKTTK